ncbi:hypothetical protein SprV_0802611900 [Sparganum proliferum]
MEVRYSCVPHQLILQIEENTRLGDDHVGGYLATTDYLRSIDTPRWKTDLAEDFCERMKLPHVSSITVSDSGVGLFIRIRDVGRMFHNPSASSSRGFADSAFHCPDAEPCHGDLLRIDLNTENSIHGHRTVFRLELCPAGGTAPRLGLEAEPGRFSSTSFPVDSLTVSIGPFYNFHSMDVLTNLELNHSLPTRGDVHHGWVKGILLEYILLYCPKLPDITGSHRVAYSFKVDHATGDTVAMATISCPPQLRLMPAILNSSTPPAQLPSEQTLQCDSHLRRWSSPIPVACRTVEEISNAYQAPGPTRPPTTSTEVSQTSCCTTEEPLAPPIDYQENHTESPSSASIIPSGSFAVVGAVAGFLLCLLLLIILLLALRKRFMEFARHKFSEGTLSTRFQNSGTLFNTLSGSLSFGRLPRSLRQHKWRNTGGGMLSQSVMTIHGSSKLVDTNSTWGSSNGNRRQPSYRRRSKISLPLLPHATADRGGRGTRRGTPGQHRRPQTNLIIGGPSSTSSRDDLLVEGASKRAANATAGHLHGTLPSPHPWSLPSPGIQYDSSSDRHLLSSTGPDCTNSLLSAGIDGSYGAGSSSQTRRQTLLSAETNLTSLSGGEDGAVVLPELPADATIEGYADSLPWRTVPRHHLLGGGFSSGFRRLSRFFHTVGSSISPSGGSSMLRKTRGSTATDSSRNSVQDVTLGRSGGLHPLPGISDRTLNATAISGSDAASLPRRLGTEERSAICLLDPTSCRLNHPQHQQPHGLSTDDFNASMQRTFIDLPSCKNLLRPDDSFARQPPSESNTLHQRTLSSTTPLVTVMAATPRLPPSEGLPPTPGASVRPKHSEAFNAETYMEPKGGIVTEQLADYAPVAEPRMKTSVSEESDTSQQQTWPSESSDSGEEPDQRQETSAGLIVCDPPSQHPPPFPASAEPHQGTNSGQQQQFAPPAEDLSDEGNTWTADYFTYDETQSQRNRPRRSDSKLVCGSNAGGDPSEVIRRPRLSPTGGLRSRPISDAMMSNHYYDDSQLISVSQINRPAGQDKRFSILSNDSLYETVAEPATSPRPYVDRLHGLSPIVESNAVAQEDVQKTLVARCRSPPPTPGIAPPYANLDDL